MFAPGEAGFLYGEIGPLEGENDWLLTAEGILFGDFGEDFAAYGAVTGDWVVGLFGDYLYGEDNEFLPGEDLDGILLAIGD